jgi:predicted nucleic acid-binding protein
MAFVLDNSVAMAWCLPDEATAYTESVLDRLRATRATVPSIWIWEAANVLLRAERRGRLTVAESTGLAETLQSLPITVDTGGLEVALGPTMALGRAHGLTAYDAAYLELAAREALPLATLDARLRTAAERMGVPLVE